VRALRPILFAATAVVLSFAATSPAQAVPGRHLSITCQEGWSDAIVIARTLVLSPGETLVIDTSGCNYTGFGPTLAGTYTYVDDGGTTRVVEPGSGGGVVPIQVGSSVSFVAPSVTRAATFQFSLVYYRGSNFYGESYQFSIAVCSGGVCPADAPVPTWVQSFQRTSQAQECPTGWAASWEQWPGGGAGGYVCTRGVPAYGA
jgi:hypothetical protein